MKKMKRMRMSDFRNDPWEHINEPIYPDVQRLFRQDDRFWVSVNEKNEKLFVINVPLRINEEIPTNLNVIEVDIVEFDAGNTRFLCILKDDSFIFDKSNGTILKNGPCVYCMLLLSSCLISFF